MSSPSIVMVTSTSASSPSLQPAASPRATTTPLPVADLQEVGTIWIGHSQTDSLGVVNLGSGQVDTLKIPARCSDFSLVFETTQVVCIGSAGQLQLLDLLTDEMRDLSIPARRWYEISPNGPYLTYLYYDSQTQSENIASYGLIEDNNTLLALNITATDDTWLTQPTVSYDGQHLAVVKYAEPNDYQVFEFVPGTSQYRQLSFGERRATWDIAWSPTALQLIYGATDIEQEIGNSPNYVMLVDIVTGQTRQLAKAPDGQFYQNFWNDPIWSSDGSRVLMVLEQKLCVITITTGEESCTQVAEADQKINLPIWSPGGDNIAFMRGSLGSSIDELVVFTPSEQRVTVLLTNVKADRLFWR